MPQTTRDPALILRRCSRHLNGDGPRSLQQQLDVLTREIAPNELPDWYGRGPLVEGFEADLAELLGKPAAVFVPTGTMAQQLALRVWSDQRAEVGVALHPTCHIEAHENRAYVHLHGLRWVPLGQAERPVSLADIQALDEPVAALVLELPMRPLGGRLPPWEELGDMTQLVRSRDIALHLDGARLWEASAGYGRPVAEIAALFDSVYVSFYKGLGALAGAALAGPTAMVAEARIWLHRHGGCLYQSFPLVLSARAALRRYHSGRFQAYQARARSLAETLRQIDGVHITPDPPHTNMMQLTLSAPAEAVQVATLKVAERTRIALLPHLQATREGDRSSCEIHVQEGALQISDAEVSQHLAEILAEARQSTASSQMG